MCANANANSQLTQPSYKTYVSWAIKKQKKMERVQIKKNVIWAAKLHNTRLIRADTTLALCQKPEKA